MPEHIKKYLKLVESVESKKELKEGVRFGGKEKSLIMKHLGEFQIGIEFEYHPNDFDENFVTGGSRVSYEDGNSDIYDAIEEGFLEEISSARYEEYSVGHSTGSGMMLVYSDYGADGTLVIKNNRSYIEYTSLTQLYDQEDNTVAINFFTFLSKFHTIMEMYDNNEYDDDEVIELVGEIYRELVESGVILEDGYFLTNFGIVDNVSPYSYYDLTQHITNTELSTLDDIVGLYEMYSNTELDEIIANNINDPEVIIDILLNKIDFIEAVEDNFENVFGEYTIYKLGSEDSVGYEDELPSSIIDNIRDVEIEHDQQYEVITHNLSISDGLDTIKAMFDYISDNGYTSGKSGMHISISTTKGKGKVDLLKYLVLSDLEYVVGYLDGNKSPSHNPLFPTRKYVGNVMENLYIAINRVLDSTVLDYIIDNNGNVTMNDITRLTAKSLLDTNVFDEKFQSIKFGDYDVFDGRIELRYFGGEDYEDKYTEIEEHIYKALYVLYVSREGTLQKQYSKQLYQIITNTVAVSEVAGSLVMIRDIKARIDKGMLSDMKTIIEFIRRTKTKYNYRLVVDTIEHYLSK